MSTHNDGEGGDYQVGFGKPPKHAQFRPGQSGNPKGAPKKQKREPVDVAAVLSEPISVNKARGPKKIPAYDAIVRGLVKRAVVDRKLNAILRFIKLCESCGLLKPPEDDSGGGVVVAPRGVKFSEWVDEVTELVPVSLLEEEDDDD